jgi:hypothetical protein
MPPAQAWTLVDPVPAALARRYRLRKLAIGCRREAIYPATRAARLSPTDARRAF